MRRIDDVSLSLANGIHILWSWSGVWQFLLFELDLTSSHLSKSNLTYKMINWVEYKRCRYEFFVFHRFLILTLVEMNVNRKWIYRWSPIEKLCFHIDLDNTVVLNKWFTDELSTKFKQKIETQRILYGYSICQVDRFDRVDWAL